MDELVLIPHVKEPNSYTLDFYLQHGGYEGMRKALGMTRLRCGTEIDRHEACVATRRRDAFDPQVVSEVAT